MPGFTVSSQDMNTYMSTYVSDEQCQLVMFICKFLDVTQNQHLRPAYFQNTNIPCCGDFYLFVCMLTAK